MTATLDGNGTLTISTTKAEGEAMPDFVPSDGISQGETTPWHDVRMNISSVIIKDGVTSIGDLAFEGCNSMNSITIPNNVTSIGFAAFGNCSNLASVLIPNSVTSIARGAFSNCTGLTSISISTGVTKIEDGTFNGCSNLSSVTIPNTVTSIGGGAFMGCTALTSIELPNSLLLIAGGSTSPNSPGSYLGAFQGSGLTSIVIPGSVTTIGVSAFYGCSNLSSVVIPNSVTSIGPAAFAGCGLKDVTVEWTTAASLPKILHTDVTYMPVDAFPSAYAAKLHVPAGAKAIYKADAGWKLFGTIDDGTPDIVSVTSVTLNTASVSMLVGDTVQLTATVTPANATNQSLRWSSSNEAVAAVSDSGLVTAKAAGTAVIVVTTVDGGFMAMCYVEVSTPEIETPGDSQPDANGKGTIGLNFTLPSDATVTGSFLIQFPEGMSLDETLTVLSAELSGNFSLSFTFMGNNTWLIEIKSNALRSVAAVEYRKIMDIAYIVNSSVQTGVYEATIRNINLTTNDGASIQEDVIPVNINVSQTITSIGNISNPAFRAYIAAHHVLKIESPQAEQIVIYSANGTQLYSVMKNEGVIAIPVSSLRGSVWIIKGSVSGTVKVVKR